MSINPFLFNTKSHVVTLPLVIAELASGEHVHVYQGHRLPDNIDPRQLEHLVAMGAASEVE